MLFSRMGCGNSEYSAKCHSEEIPYDAVVHAESWFRSLNESISNEVRNRRIAANLSINALATLSGVSWDMVKAVETGKHRPSIDTLARLAVALETTPAEILTIAEQKIS